MSTKFIFLHRPQHWHYFHQFIRPTIAYSFSGTSLLASTNSSFIFVRCGWNNSDVSFSSNTLLISFNKPAFLLMFSSLQISTRKVTRFLRTSFFQWHIIYCFNFRWVSFWRFWLISFVLFFCKIVKLCNFDDYFGSRKLSNFFPSMFLLFHSFWWN